MEQLDDETLNVVTYPNEYGAFIYITVYAEEPDKTIPEDLKAVLDLAVKNDCAWVKIDCDGPEIDGLETYEWD